MSDDESGWNWAFPVFLIFLILKLSHVIDWSWWIVTLPLWIGPALVLAVLALIFAGIIVGSIAVVIAMLVSSSWDVNYEWRRKRRLAKLLKDKE